MAALPQISKAEYEIMKEFSYPSKIFFIKKKYLILIFRYITFVKYNI